MPIMKKRGRKPKASQVGGGVMPAKRGWSELACTDCGEFTRCSAEAAKVTCANCVQKQVEPPDAVIKAREAQAIASGEMEPRKRGRPRKSPAPAQDVPSDKKPIAAKPFVRANKKEKKGPKAMKTGKNPGWPRCWWLKKSFVGPDGVTYNRGAPKS